MINAHGGLYQFYIWGRIRSFSIYSGVLPGMNFCIGGGNKLIIRRARPAGNGLCACKQRPTENRIQ